MMREHVKVHKITINACNVPIYWGDSKLIVNIIQRVGVFFKKRAPHTNFTQKPPLQPLFYVLYQNKALCNFHKSRQ